MKKIIIVITIAMLFFTKCIAQQTIVNITEPLEAGKYFKDLDNSRDNFIGTWLYTDGNKEFILHLYKLDMVRIRHWNGYYRIDKIIGNYIYKENGNTIINTVMYMPNINSAHTPFVGLTRDGTSLISYESHIIDYGTKLYNYECEVRHKRGMVNMKITNLNSGNPLQATLSITATEEKRHINPNCDTEDTDIFTIPTDMVLTKISNITPPLN